MTINRSIIFNSIFLFVVFLSFENSLFSTIVHVEHQSDSIILLAEKHFQTSNNDSACYYFQTALALSNESKYYEGIIKSQIGLANCNFISGDYVTVQRITNKSLELLQQRNFSDTMWLTILYSLKGAAEYGLRKPEQSISSLKAGIDLYGNNLKQDSIYTLLYKTLGNDYFLLGNLDNAKSAYEQALKNELEINDTNLQAASLIMNIGIILSQRGDYLKGEEYFNKSLQIKERETPDNKKNFTRVYLNLGRLQTMIGKVDEALVNFNKAEINYLEKYGMESEYLIPIYLNKGGLYIVKNDLEKALIYHEKALELTIRYKSPEDPAFSKISGNLGFIHLRLGNYRKAIEYLKTEDNVIRQTESRIRALRNLASCYQNLGKFETARQYYKKAINVAIEEGEENLQYLQYCYLDYGHFNDLSGDFNKAAYYLKKGVELTGEYFGNTSVNYASAITKLGKHYDTINDFRKALYYFQESLIIYSEGFNDTSFYSNPGKNQLIPEVDVSETLYNKARSLHSLYNLKSKNERDLIASYETIKLAIGILEKIRTAFTNEKSKLQTTQNSKVFFELATRISLKLAKITNDSIYINEAFIFSEKGKSAVLLSTIKEFQALSFGGIPADVLALESKLKNDIAIFTNLIYDENQNQNKNDKNLSSWRDQLIIQNRIYDSLITLFESEYPEYYQLKYNSSAINISELQSGLSDTEILIEYDLFDTVLVIFTITNNDIKYSKVKMNETFINDIREFIEITHEYPLVENANERMHFFANSSHKLYNVLLKPIYAEIKNKKEIIIIPDDILGFISFESLIKQLPPAKIKGYNKLDYLINDYCIRYSYSASLLSKTNRKTSKKINILAIAPTYSKDYILTSTGQGLGLSLGPLDYAKQEVENIQNYYPCEILDGDNATESKFKLLAKEFDILHFSMHTIINNDEPLASKLVFSLNNDSVDDGFLNTYEIYNLPLKANLAVLSSCETGGGKLSKGEGILSLARGFIYSGVSSIVMTLWEIDDVSSADIMSGFYKRLKTGEKIDEALRNSKLNYLHTTDQLHAHPYFWSAYVQIGDNLPIVANSFPILTILIVSGVIVVMIIVIIFLRRKKTGIN